MDDLSCISARVYVQAWGENHARFVSSSLSWSWSCSIMVIFMVMIMVLFKIITFTKKQDKKACPENIFLWSQQIIHVAWNTQNFELLLPFPSSPLVLGALCMTSSDFHSPLSSNLLKPPGERILSKSTLKSWRGKISHAPQFPQEDTASQTESLKEEQVSFQVKLSWDCGSLKAKWK